MNLYNQDEYYQFANELVDYLEQWPQLSAAQREQAVLIEVAMQEFHEAGSCFWSETLPDGSYDGRGFGLGVRYKWLERNPGTAAHVAQARTELASLVHHERLKS